MNYLTEVFNNALNSSFLIAIAIAYITGVITSFTPCTYPLIPITFSIISAKTLKTSSSKNLILMTLMYVLGITVVYTMLGVIAAMTGQLFGSFGNPRLINSLIGILIIILGLSLFEVIKIPLPIIDTSRFFKKYQGYSGTFFTGLISGFVFSPCTAPVLGILLTWISSTHNWLLGALIMFAFSWGLSTILILIGIFSGKFLQYLKSGPWMVWVKNFLAISMLLIGIYYILR